ncbi:MAG: hypothetical protein IT488_01110 [Gammaproteobacteria bacterium]|nr:hypothetical protein [Gammaproteobacteria bacterium]
MMVRLVLLVLLGFVLTACSEGKDFQLKVRVTGMNGAGLVLQNNGTDNLTVNGNGLVPFPLDYPFAYPYKVTVATNPTSPDQLCVVENSEGRLTESVDNVLVRCTNAYRVSGTVVDLTGEDLIIMNNSSERLTIDANGGFTFARLIADGGPYQVSILQQPTNQLCTVENSAGSISGANITDVVVVCGTRTVSGTLSGLTGARQIVLQNNGTDNLTLTQDGDFTFATTFFDGADYLVTVNTQPFNQVCVVENDAGTVDGANITDVEVSCGFTVGGNITGPSGATVVIQNNGVDDLSLGMNRTFTFTTGLPVGATFNVTLLQVPDGLSCTIVNGSGEMVANPVGNVAINCREGTTLSVEYGIKQVRLSWLAVSGIDAYRVMRSTDGGDTYTEIGADPTALSFTDTPVNVHLNDWVNLSYKVQSCVGQDEDEVCIDSNILSPLNSARATGYFKASNTATEDNFGYAVALSGDGNTLVAGAPFEDSDASGVFQTLPHGAEDNDAAADSGAAYVFVRDVDGAWTQQAYLKASNSGAGDQFGFALGLSDDGSTLTVGAPFEDSDASGVFQTLPHGAENNDAAADSGAAYVFVRDIDGVWTQQAYVKASNAEAGDGFAAAIALSGDGDTLAAGAAQEDSNGSAETDNSADASGAAYVYARAGASWSFEDYLKASNAEAGDSFARSLSLSVDGDTLAVGAPLEDSNASGEGDNSAANSGSAYVYARTGASWNQEAYVKAATAATVPDIVAGDNFGFAVAVSGNGATLAVGAPFEDSAALSLDGVATDDCEITGGVNCAVDSGAAYVYLRGGATWNPQAYVKATNTEEVDLFGQVLRLTANGDMLAVGAVQEDSQTTGVGGEQSDNAANNSGAAYLFARVGSDWSDLAYVKASTSGEDDNFGFALDLSSNGTTLVASAPFEDGDATGVGGEVGDEQDDDSAADAGAVYLY